jgi:hypothetical protein
MKMKSVALVVAMGLTVLTTGCASVTGGTSETVSVKTQKDSVEVTGADCVLTNSKGSYKVTTPGKVDVHPASGDLTVKCTKDGEQDAVATFQSKTRKGTVAGNILMFGVVGYLVAGPVDAATGAMFTYPESITMSFGGAATTTQVPTDVVATQSAQAK